MFSSLEKIYYVSSCTLRTISISDRIKLELIRSLDLSRLLLLILSWSIPCSEKNSGHSGVGVSWISGLIRLLGISQSLPIEIRQWKAFSSIRNYWPALDTVSQYNRISTGLPFLSMSVSFPETPFWIAKTIWGYQTVVSTQYIHTFTTPHRVRCSESQYSREWGEQRTRWGVLNTH